MLFSLSINKCFFGVNVYLNGKKMKSRYCFVDKIQNDLQILLFSLLRCSKPEHIETKFGGGY